MQRFANCHAKGGFDLYYTMNCYNQSIGKKVILQLNTKLILYTNNTQTKSKTGNLKYSFIGPHLYKQVSVCFDLNKDQIFRHRKQYRFNLCNAQFKPKHNWHFSYNCLCLSFNEISSANIATIVNKVYRLFLIILSLGVQLHANAQEDTLRLSLPAALEMAREQSPQYRINRVQQQNSYWEYRMFQSNYLPQLRLDATLPNFSRNIEPIVQPDGSEIFRARARMNNSLRMSLSQSITRSNTNIFVSSGLQRIDNFQPIENYAYNSSPVYVGIDQPIFGFNALAWDRQTEPIRFTMSQKIFNQDMEMLGSMVSELYFELLLAQTQLSLARNNLAANEAIYDITQQRNRLGRANEEELLQIELSVINAEQELRGAQAAMQNAALEFSIMLGLPGSESIQVTEDIRIPDFTLDEALALRYAMEYNPKPDEFALRKREAERNLAQARGETGMTGNLYASVGLNGLSGQNERLSMAYQDPLNQQLVNFGISIPILDWGRTKARRNSAQAERELVEANVHQEQLNFEQEIITKIRQIDILTGQVSSSERARSIANRRWTLAQNRFQQGQMPITDLTIAREEKDRANNNYINALRDFWVSYYELRALTLYDFESGSNIDHMGNMDDY